MTESRHEKERQDHFARFDKMGESAVRVQAPRWESTSRVKFAYAQEWLRLQEEERALAAFSRRDAREEETLSIARQALASSRSANRIAIAAMILSITTAISIAIIMR